MILIKDWITTGYSQTKLSEQIEECGSIRSRQLNKGPVKWTLESQDKTELLLSAVKFKKYLVKLSIKSCKNQDCQNWRHK